MTCPTLRFIFLRALHLADLITELNGESLSLLCSGRSVLLIVSVLALIAPLTLKRRLLRFHVYPLIHALLPRPARLLGQYMGRARVHAIRALLRLYGRQSCPVEGQKQSNGTGIGLFGRFGTWQFSLDQLILPAYTQSGRKISLNHPRQSFILLSLRQC